MKEYKQCESIKTLIDKHIECIRATIKDDPDSALYYLDNLQVYTNLLADVGNEYETTVVNQISKNRERILGLV